MTSILVIINLISVSAMRASLLLLAVLAVLASSQASSISEVLVKEQWEVSLGSSLLGLQITLNTGLENKEWERIPKPRGGEIPHEDLDGQHGENGETQSGRRINLCIKHFYAV